ncbi:MAG: arginyltransferase [Alphaproteobacteria bacterium]|nr:arginyltransferase [Alphaproteobacteria bacterium]
MSIIMSGSSLARRFYLSGPAPCPYLSGLVERKLLTRLNGSAAEDQETNDILTRAGFRRSHDIIYRPACEACNACTPVRIPVNLFQPSHTQKRTARRNNDLHVTVTEPQANGALYTLFIDYQKARHGDGDGDMVLMGFDEFEAMIANHLVQTRLLQLHDKDNTLLGVMMMDEVSDGASAVYSFFDPTQPRRSLGTHLILSLIDHVRQQQKEFVYMGDWIEGSRKMSYKAQFHPQQTLDMNGWVTKG